MSSKNSQTLYISLKQRDIHTGAIAIHSATALLVSSVYYKHII